MTVRTNPNRNQTGSVSRTRSQRVPPKIVKIGTTPSPASGSSTSKSGPTPTRVTPKIIKNIPPAHPQPTVAPTPTRVAPRVSPVSNIPSRSVAQTSQPSQRPAVSPIPASSNRSVASPSTSPLSRVGVMVSPRRPLTSPRRDGEDTTAPDRFSLEAPGAVQDVAPSALFPGFNASPMFTLSRIQSGIGVLNIALEGSSQHNLEAIIEEQSGRQLVIPRNFQWFHGVLLTKGGDISIDLHRASSLRRLTVFVEGECDATLVASSADFEWRRTFPIRLSGSGVTSLMSGFFVDGLVTLRNDGSRFPNRRDMAQNRAYSTIPWRDENTHLHD